MATNKLPLKLLIDKKDNKVLFGEANSHSSSKAMATNKLPLKLLIDKKDNKVLFGEANKEFIDFLFSLMSIPVGSLIKLLSKEKMVGCLGDLYGSIETLSDTYVQPNQNKHSILKTESAYFDADSTFLICNEPTKPSTVQKKYYKCSRGCKFNITSTWGTVCASCNSQMNTEVTLVGSTGTVQEKYYRCSDYDGHYQYGVTNTLRTACPGCGCEMNTKVTVVGSTGTGTNNAAASAATTGEGGYVKGVVTYMVMDNLVVMPMSTISSITLLNKFKVQDVGTLVEKVVYLGMDEGLELLNASLQSKTALTDVFLSKKQVK